MTARFFARHVVAGRKLRIHKVARWHRLDRCPEVLDVEVSVSVGGQLGVLMAEDSLNAVEIDTGAQQQRRSRVPQVVEAHLSQLGPRPQLHPALRAFAKLGVCVALGVRLALRFAPSADVLVAID